MTDISGAMPRLDFHMTRAGDGTAVTGADYRGKVVALYFGYTNCPDVCPATLANLADMLEQVKSPDVRVLFVSVDPTATRRKRWRIMPRLFHPRLTGLRGSDDALADLARRYRVAYTVNPAALYGDAFQCGVLFRS